MLLIPTVIQGCYITTNRTTAAGTLSNSDTTELHQKQNNQQQRLPLKATVTQGSYVITKEQQQQWLLLKMITAQEICI